MRSNMSYQWEQLAAMFAHLGEAAKELDDVRQHVRSDEADEVIPLAILEPN